MKVFCVNKEPYTFAPAEAARLPFLELFGLYTVAIEFEGCECFKHPGEKRHWFGLVEIPGKTRGGKCLNCRFLYPSQPYLMFMALRFREALPDETKKSIEELYRSAPEQLVKEYEELKR